MRQVTLAAMKRAARRWLGLTGAFALLAATSCSSSDATSTGAGGAAGGAGTDAAAAGAPDAAGDAPPDAEPDVMPDAGDGALAACPPEMIGLGTFCIDRYEAPDVEGQLPLVMYTFDEADTWCTTRGKRLCFDDEWTTACEGPQQTSYPYGDALQPGNCNDDKTWIAYNQTKLNGWPWTLPASSIDRLPDLLAAASADSAAGATAAAEVQRLYQGTAAGDKPGCSNVDGAFDLEGNVEEWTRRRDGGQPSFHGSLKGRYWAEPRTCQSAVTVHGDAFRFYEIGFRCCRDVAGAD